MGMNFLAIIFLEQEFDAKFWLLEDFRKWFLGSDPED